MTLDTSSGSFQQRIDLMRWIMRGGDAAVFARLAGIHRSKTKNWKKAALERRVPPSAVRIACEEICFRFVRGQSPREIVLRTGEAAEFVEWCHAFFVVPNRSYGRGTFLHEAPVSKSQREYLAACDRFILWDAEQRT